MAVRLVSVGDDFKLPSRLVVTEASLPIHLHEASGNTSVNEKIAAAKTEINASVDTKLVAVTNSLNANVNNQIATTEADLNSTVNSKIATAETNINGSVTSKVAAAKLEIKNELSPTFPKVVNVATGSEARPDADLVFWVGGLIQPVNMGLDDLWFKAEPGPDLELPSAPTALAASSITNTSMTLSWTAATDNVGVTGYSIYLNNVLKSTTAGTTTAGISGLVAGTTYSITVTARDAAGNVSQPSAPLSVKTLAPVGSPRHSIWLNDEVFPYAVTKSTESTNIEVANRFYSYGTSPDVSNWRIIGAKLYIPAGVTMAGPIQFYGRMGTDLLNPAHVTGTLSNPVSGEWNEVMFNGAMDTDAGAWAWISYKASDASYLGFSTPSEGFVTASDGSHIVLAETAMGRSCFIYDNTTAIINTSAVYGIDVIYDEGPAA